MTEADLDRRVWMPLIFGWITAREVYGAIIAHNVAEYWKLWLRTGRTPCHGAPADLQITMKPENSHKLVSKMIPPPLLMLTGQMKIKGFGAMGTFAKLFPEPKLDQRIDPSAL
jgi:hypothetical protein